jgi:predicted short-subunit dehydrogenase-like oxidoreductase (DUF2520 family)
MARTISIVGAGRVGKTLGKRLRELGWRVGAVVTRSATTSRAAVRFIGAGIPCANLASGGISKLFRGSELQLRHKNRLKRGASAPEGNALARALEADVILISTPDNALAAVAKSLAQVGSAACRNKIILHTSGALDRQVLAPLARLGASTGSLHPMQTFTGRGVPKLKNVTFAIEGDRRALRTAKEITKAFGGVPVAINGKDKPTYHATAVLVCGSEFALMEAAIRILTRIGFTRRRALQTLLPLTRQMLDNIERLGPRAAWTGPMSRGDYAIVAKHAKALRKFPSEYLNAYAVLAQLAGRVLSKNSSAAIKHLRRALKNTGGGTI